MISSRCHPDASKSSHHHQTRSSGIGGGNGGSSGCGAVSGNVCHGGSGVPCEPSTCDRYKGAVDSLLKASEAVQGRLCERSMLKIEKPSTKAILHGIEAVGKCGERMKSVQELGYGKHETAKSKGHEVGHGFKVENIKYYGELKGYDFKSYGTIDKPAVSSAHEKSHSHGPEKNGHEKCHSKTSSSSTAMQNYGLSKVAGERSTEKNAVYADHYYHRSSHSKPQSAYQVYQETKYSYNVSGVPGTPAQASAAAAFFARSVTRSTIYYSRSRASTCFRSDLRLCLSFSSPNGSHCFYRLSVIVRLSLPFVYVTPTSTRRDVDSFLLAKTLSCTIEQSTLF